MEFRKLRHNEIDCRVSTINEKGLSLLLYKDARVDQRVLDETLGIYNWQRSHQLIGDRLYCTVEIWDPDKSQWIKKQDVGTESYTEKEKGQASDSFKRACFNLGIGRELYTAPFIWVPAGRTDIINKNGKMTTYDRFSVDEIGYDDEGINRLVIRGKKGIVFQMGEPVTAEQKNQSEYDRKAGEYITRDMLVALKVRAKNDNVSEEKLADKCGVDSLEQLTCALYTNINMHWDKVKEACHE